MAASFSDRIEKAWAGDSFTAWWCVWRTKAPLQGRAGGLRGEGSGPSCAEWTR